MEDKELLKMAAKAAGIVSLRWGIDCPERQINGEGQFIGATWNPLEDDGDALRLAVKLEMRLSLLTQEISAQVESRTDSLTARMIVAGDPMIAARRAIVSAAAEIARCAP